MTLLDRLKRAFAKPQITVVTYKKTDTDYEARKKAIHNQLRQETGRGAQRG